MPDHEIDPGDLRVLLAWQHHALAPAGPHDGGNKAPTYTADTAGSFFARVEPLRGAELIAASTRQQKATTTYKVTARAGRDIRPLDRLIVQATGQTLEVVDRLPDLQWGAYLTLTATELVAAT